MTPVRINVDTPSRKYTITIGENIIDDLPRLLDEAQTPPRRFVVSNPLVWRLHGSRLAAINVTEPILVPDGERYKLTQTVGRVYDALIRGDADRASTLITLGGGVLGDLAGFAAASYCAAFHWFTCRRPFSRKSTARSAARSASTIRSART